MPLLFSSTSNPSALLNAHIAFQGPTKQLSNQTARQTPCLVGTRQRVRRRVWYPGMAAIWELARRATRAPAKPDSTSDAMSG